MEFAVLGAFELVRAELALDLLCDAGDEDSFNSSVKKRKKLTDLMLKYI